MIPTRLKRQEISELINSMEAAGNDASHLRAILATLPQPAQPRQGSRFRQEEELTTAEYLHIRVGHLFPNGITDAVLAQLIVMDRNYSLKELQAMCKDAGLSGRGDKKALAAKLLASGFVEKPRAEEVEVISEEFIDFNQQREWSGRPGELKIPESYIKDLRYEIVVFARKERGGSDFTFRCRQYERTAEGQWRFAGVIIDTSIKNPQGEVELARLTYHPEIMLVDIGFMVLPAPEAAAT